jgi:hypothetical protein
MTIETGIHPPGSMTQLGLPRGVHGALTVAQQDAAIDMLLSGLSQTGVAAHFGVTKNTIAGVWARSGNGQANGPVPTTLIERCDALHVRMDAVLAETLGVGRVPTAPQLGLSNVQTTQPEPQRGLKNGRISQDE